MIDTRDATCSAVSVLDVSLPSVMATTARLGDPSLARAVLVKSRASYNEVAPYGGSLSSDFSASADTAANGDVCVDSTSKAKMPKRSISGDIQLTRWCAASVAAAALAGIRMLPL